MQCICFLVSDLIIQIFVEIFTAEISQVLLIFIYKHFTYREYLESNSNGAIVLLNLQFKLRS